MNEENHYIERIHSALQVTFHQMQPEMLESMNAQGVTPTQLFVLTYLKKQGSCKISELAQQMEVKPSAVTFMIDRLEQHQYVIREHDKKDRRVVNIRLTNEGQEKVAKVFEERKKIVAQYLSHLTADELSFLANIAEKLAQPITVQNNLT